MELSKCANDVQDNSFQYCSDVVDIHVTVAKSLITVDMPGAWPSRSRVDAPMCTGGGKHPMPL